MSNDGHVVCDGIVTSYCVMDLGHHCCSYLPSRCLHRCKHIFYEVLWYSPGGNFTGNGQGGNRQMCFKTTSLNANQHLPGGNELNTVPLTFGGYNHFPGIIRNRHQIAGPWGCVLFCQITIKFILCFVVLQPLSLHIGAHYFDNKQL